jgi:hypothetical protein
VQEAIEPGEQTSKQGTGAPTPFGSLPDTLAWGPGGPIDHFFGNYAAFAFIFFFVGGSPIGDFFFGGSRIGGLLSGGLTGGFLGLFGGSLLGDLTTLII